MCQYPPVFVSERIPPTNGPWPTDQPAVGYGPSVQSTAQQPQPINRRPSKAHQKPIKSPSKAHQKPISVHKYSLGTYKVAD
ncbi:hypothetical protein VN97_g1120 [Penicillium thymicola]|uniref:Uncharacterized protein n=1 Tax=Penicillium thymicola TaxID=293382 RepID=A0AAI9TS10_PENTH|nr:hypothetical protein VN97_g1120 [Penicillium thymicola]